MKKIIGFYNLDELVADKSALSDLPRNDKWMVLPYESAKYSGRMLCCHESALPEPLELKIDLKGWYKIYIGIINASYNYRLGVTIGDLGKTIVVPPSAKAWCCNEFGNRIFYRAADMTGRTLTISKPGPYYGASAAISFLEFEEMSEEEIAEYTRKEGGITYYHFDEGFACECTYEKDKDYLGCLNHLEGSGGGLIAIESVSASKVFGKPKDMGEPFTDFIGKSFSALDEYRQKRVRIKSMLIDRAHQLGYEIYSANRIQAGDYQLPLAREMVETFIVDGNEELQIETRDGKQVPALSYAYEKVRRMSVESIIHATDGLPFDGVCLTFHRGIFFGFEEPVRREVMEKYGVDACVLPAADPRLHKVWCSYATEFLRLLRKELDKTFGEGKKISVIVFSDPESSRNFGYDVEEWLKEGLVSSVAQGLMRWEEDLTDCLAEDGTIDLKKYKSEIEKRIVLTREYKFNDPTQLLDGAVAFEKLCKPYGVDFYATLGWDGGDPQKIVDLAKKFRAAGVEKIFSWNTNRKICTPDLINAEKFISANYSRGLEGNFEKSERFRVLKYNNNDISYFHVNWNG